MIYLEQPEEIEEIAELAKSIGDELISPAARDAEREGAVPKEVWSRLFETGLTVPVPEELGGGGIPDALTFLAAVENLAYGDPGIALASFWSGSAALFIARHGSADQKALLSALASNPDARGSVAAYEGFGRNPSEYETTIAVEGDQVRVVGRKVGVAFAASADPLIVVGRDPGTGALRAVVLTSAHEGVTVEHAGPGLALDAAQLATLTFNVTVPVAALLGGVDVDSVGLRASVNQFRIFAASAALGAGQRAVEYAAKYATERVAFGVPIASFQGVSFPLAEALMRLDAARLELNDLALAVEEGSPDGTEDRTAQAVGYATESAVQATRDAVQTLGGHGFIEDHPVELWYRSTAALASLDFDPARTPFAARL